MNRDTELNFKAAKFVATECGVWQNTILLGTVGSTVHGTNISDGVEDLDLMGVCIEPINRALGFQEFEQFIYRTAVAREGENARSMAGDVDMTIYSLRKYLRLALKGNPTILTLLFVPGNHLQLRERHVIGMSLQNLASVIVSKKAGSAYLGYMQAQKQRLTGERGGRHGSRPELINRFGYDSKYAAHILRLGWQGIELMETGKLTLPMAGLNREFVLSVRRGEMPLNDMLTSAGIVERQLKEAIEITSLPNEPNTSYVEDWMIRIYQDYWLLKRANSWT